MDQSEENGAYSWLQPPSAPPEVIVYSVLPPSPVEYACIVCNQAILTEFKPLPCQCLVPIHTECIARWKRRRGTCIICKRQWDDPSIEKSHNVKWAIFCISVVGLTAGAMWFFYTFLIKHK
jgi:hypothetical protein